MLATGRNIIKINGLTGKSFPRIPPLSSSGNPDDFPSRSRIHRSGNVDGCPGCGLPSRASRPLTPPPHGGGKPRLPALPEIGDGGEAPRPYDTSGMLSLSEAAESY